jgi:hypothetical protein
MASPSGTRELFGSIAMGVMPTIAAFCSEGGRDLAVLDPIGETKIEMLKFRKYCQRSLEESHSPLSLITGIF